jgi:high-affinity iron transporter
MEAVVFVGGVSLGQKATAIPLAAIVGIICGLVVGYLIYAFASRSGTPCFFLFLFLYENLPLNDDDNVPQSLSKTLALRVFMIAMTNFLLLIGAGLFSKATSNFLTNRFDRLYVRRLVAY